MPYFTIYAQVTQDLEVRIFADTEEDAEEIADQDLILEDFDVVHAVFTLGSTVKAK